MTCGIISVFDRIDCFSIASINDTEIGAARFLESSGALLKGIEVDSIWTV